MTEPSAVDNGAIPALDIDIEVRRLLRMHPQPLRENEAPEETPLIRAKAKEHAINRRLLIEEARRRGITVDTDEVERIYARIAALYPDQTSFENHLKTIDSSPARLRKTIQDARIVEKLVAEVTSSVREPTTAEIDAYIDQAIPSSDRRDNRAAVEKIRDTTRRLEYARRRNEALTCFIAGLRDRAQTGRNGPDHPSRTGTSDSRQGV